MEFFSSQKTIHGWVLREKTSSGEDSHVIVAFCKRWLQSYWILQKSLRRKGKFLAQLASCILSRWLYSTKNHLDGRGDIKCNGLYTCEYIVITRPHLVLSVRDLHDACSQWSSMLPYSGHFDFTILYFVVKTKQIGTICSEDLSTSLLSSLLFAAELCHV